MTTAKVGSRADAVKRFFELPLLIAAVLSIPSTILEFSNIGEPWVAVGAGLNWVIWLAFLAELVTMLAVVPDRGRYLVANPLDLAIVLMTPPFIANGIQSIRLLRLLRLFRLLRLAPLVRVIFSLEGIRAAAALALFTALAGGAGFAAEEGMSLGNGVYWSIATMTTVGDNLTPHTTEGKIISVIVMLVGIGTATLVIGAVAQRFMAPTVEEIEIAEDDLLVQVHEISLRLGRLETALRERGRTQSELAEAVED